MFPALFSTMLVWAIAHDLWYAAPLVVVVSLVYAATRHELMSHILPHAGRTALWIIVFMGAIYLLLAWLTRGL